MAIPVFRPSYTEAEFQAVREVMASGCGGEHRGRKLGAVRDFGRAKGLQPVAET